MENKGAVNRYSTQTTDIFTINLHAGVTPMFLTYAGKRYSSCCYCLRVNRIDVTHVWYRPVPEEFAKLDVSSKRHVLNGGLLFGPLGVNGINDDPTMPDVDYETFQKWCEQVYGERL